jgi:DNA-binding MarR family transcriptional regulator
MRHYMEHSTPAYKVAEMFGTSVERIYQIRNEARNSGVSLNIIPRGAPAKYRLVIPEGGVPRSKKEEIVMLLKKSPELSAGEVAEKLSCSRNTVNHVRSDLIKAGLAEKRQGRRTENSTVLRRITIERKKENVFRSRLASLMLLIENGGKPFSARSLEEKVNEMHGVSCADAIERVFSKKLFSHIQGFNGNVFDLPSNVLAREVTKRYPFFFRGYASTLLFQTAKEYRNLLEQGKK